MAVSEVDKCYICELIGDFDEFKDIKEKFDVQHECWKQQQNQDSKKVRRGFQNSETENAHKINETTELMKNNYCDAFDKNFISKGYLETHKKNIHEKRKDEKCDMCDKKYSTPSSLFMHKKTKHGGKIVIF